MAKWATTTWRWLQQMYTDRLGADATVLPESLGGTGTTSTAQTVAAQNNASSSTSVTAQTESVVGYTLNAVETGSAGDFNDTTVTWPNAFADTSYTVTLSFHQSGTFRGTVSEVVASRTTTSIKVRLTNTSDFGPDEVGARGTVDATGVHT